jgi:unsaturated rhamnogalacturonyl hydrolase
MQITGKVRRVANQVMIGVLCFVAPTSLALQGQAHRMTEGSMPLGGLPFANQRTSPPLAPGVDWSRAVVDSTLRRYPTATELGSWGYAKALFLMGEYMVWKRTGDSRYLQYIRSWVDSHVDAQGNMDHGTENLDSMLPGNLLLLLYQETGEEKYKLAADKIRQRLNTYPRTADGGFWHASSASRHHQLWGDGVFMSVPFLVRYGRLFGESAYANDEAAKQLIVYAGHLRSPEGLLYHAYDESGAASWADPATHHSSEFWCRAMGWFGMTLIDVLDALPAADPKRQPLIAILQDLVRGLAKYQDSETGLWYQVVDKGSTQGNWLETSSSSMYSYVIAMAVKRGYVDKKYEAIARKGYNGVLTKISLGADGMANITDICEGTNVSDLAYYFARKRNVNDFHGLGAFLIMNEYFLTGQSAMELTSPSRKTVRVAVTNPSRERRVEDVVLRVAEIQRMAPDFNAVGAVVIADDARAPSAEPPTADAADPARQLPSQADDLDGDGRPDELAFQIELQPRQTRTVAITYGGPAGLATPRADYPKRTDARFAKHYDGMGWESETTAWRLYFDKRNAIDLWGKRKPGLYLETFAAADYKYQEESPLGRDIYNVGKSLGAGGVGAWIDGHAIPVTEVANRTWRIISTGPVRSIVEFTYEGWKVGDRVVTLRSRITQWAGERGYEHWVTLNGTVDHPEDFPLVAGISRKPGLKEVDGTTCSLALWGPQIVKPGTGATDSLPDQNLGLAIVVPEGHQGCRREGDPLNYLVQPQLKNGAARWYVLAAWDQESAQPVKNLKEFTTLVKQETARLAQPASVVIVSRPQAATASTPVRSADPQAVDTVKYFSAAEVHASFEKGSPLINKDGRNYWVITGRREKSGQSELHEKDTDVFYIVQGSATFVTGGKMLDPKTTAPGEVRGSGIEGGQTLTLSKDDVIVIPAGVPHWFKDVQGTFLYFVVKTQ